MGVNVNILEHVHTKLTGHTEIVCAYYVLQTSQFLLPNCFISSVEKLLLYLELGSWGYVTLVDKWTNITAPYMVVSSDSLHPNIMPVVLWTWKCAKKRWSLQVKCSFIHGYLHLCWIDMNIQNEHWNCIQLRDRTTTNFQVRVLWFRRYYSSFSCLYMANLQKEVKTRHTLRYKNQQ